MVVGWDGGTWEMIDPLLAAGRLPNLERLIAGGSTARLASSVVPISSAAWIGAVTGRTPGETGVYGFFEPIPESYDVSLISARSNQATPIWRTLSRHGLRSVVLGVPVTYPPEPIEGVMVGGMLAPEDSTYTWPPGLTARLRTMGYRPDIGIWREANQLSGEILERQLAAKRQAILELLAEEDWDLAFVVWKELDVLSHFYYDGRADGHVATLYQLLDRELGVLLAAVGTQTRVLLVSDHGFHPYPTSFFLHPWLIEAGYAVRRKDGKPPVDLSDLTLDKRRALENAQQMSELDLASTHAFAGLSEGNFGGVRLNLAGREPRGKVAPADAPALLDEIEARLRAQLLPGSDRPLVVRTWRGAELYPGPYQDLLPDLLFETDPEVAVRQASHVRAFEAVAYPDHKREGILVAAGPDAVARAERGEAEIFDVGPTALWLLGLCGYEEMDGRALSELFSGLPAPCAVPEASERQRRRELEWLGDTRWSDPEMEELKRRLAELGYAESR